MINQHEANIVKYIFESYAKGHGYRKIANALNHKGYVTKKAIHLVFQLLLIFSQTHSKYKDNDSRLKIRRIPLNRDKVQA